MIIVDQGNVLSVQSSSVLGAVPMGSAGGGAVTVVSDPAATPPEIDMAQVEAMGDFINSVWDGPLEVANH